MLEIDGLKVGYGRTDVVHGVSLTVGAGEIVAVMGTTVPARPPC